MNIPKISSFYVSLHVGIPGAALSGGVLSGFITYGLMHGARAVCTKVIATGIAGTASTTATTTAATAATGATVVAGVTAVTLGTIAVTAAVAVVIYA